MNSGGGAVRGAPVRAARQISLREHNLGLVLQTVVDSDEPLSRAQVSALVGLTRATVSALVDQLLKAKLLQELEPVTSARSGRPGTPLSPARGTVLGLGLEINVDYIGVRAIDLAGEVFAESVLHYDAREKTPRENMAIVAAEAERVRDRADASGAVIAHATFALPGVVDIPRGPLRIAPNLGWQNVDVHGLISEFPALAGFDVHFANEANLAAVAEVAARAEKNFIYVSGEIGVGGALVLDGEVFGGQHGWSSELGHVTVDPAGQRCTCGARGCLERVAGQEELLEAAGIPSGEANAGTGISGLISALESADQRALEAVQNAARAFGIALGDVINLFDVNTVVIGGFHAGLLPWLEPHISREMGERALTSNWARPRVVEPIIRDGAALTGAALTSLRGVVEKPAEWLERLSAGSAGYSG